MINVVNGQIVVSHSDMPEARLALDFRRTLRVGDVGKTSELPPNLGNFPLLPVTGRVAEKMGPKHAERGGVVLPMYQAEALWIDFRPSTGERRPSAWPFAIKVMAGKLSAVTGKPYEAGLREGDYCVAPKQLWIDGFATESGLVKQFIAAPLGSGVTVEGQLTGEEAFGGLQIETYPMKAEFYEARFPRRPEPTFRSRAESFGGDGGGVLRSYTSYSGEEPRILKTASVQTMGMAAGGAIEQQIFADEFGLDAWDLTRGDRVFVHLLNALAWETVTGQRPPASPATPERYKREGYAWFDYYVEGAATLGGDAALSGVKSAAEMAALGGPNILPDNEDTTPAKVVSIPIPSKPQGNIPPGAW
jgi:hypothetical protein